MSFWILISCTLNGAVPQAGTLLQQPYKASIGVTPELAACPPSEKCIVYLKEEDQNKQELNNKPK